MITEQSDPETKTLFMLLANIAQSELANQIPTVNNNMAAAIRAATIRLSHDVIRIAIQSSRYDTFAIHFRNLRQNAFGAFTLTVIYIV